MDLCQEYQGFLVPCCEDDYPATPPMTGEKPPDMSECNSLLSGCERELCRAKKMGFIGDDGEIDRAKLVDAMFKKVADDPGLMAEVKSKCIDGDFESYAPTNTCVFQKISRCVLMQWLKRCTKWGENETCQTFKGLIKECVKIFP
nr:uncharacterized protein LOC110373344 [Helicoverpa armigera]